MRIFLINSISKSSICKSGRLLLMVFLLLVSYPLLAQTVTVPSGSLIIDMGVSPQTVENGLKPYGLAYELINIRKVPLVWSINPAKAKDGIDFSVDGRNFRGGPFIVLKQYLADPDVQATIATWETKGVLTYTTNAEVVVDIYREVTIWPRWVLDQANGNIARGYLDLAEIPASAYSIGLPSDLDACDDLFILPHADPTWADHGYLYDWNDSFANGGSEGWLWSGCHAVSVFEALVNPLDSSERMNFLSNDPTPFPDPFHPGLDGFGLIDFGDHDNGSGLGYLYANQEDSFMQFLGTLDGATENGSEQVYLPYPTGSWRPSTKISVWDPNQSDVLNGDSPGLAAKLAYGHAFGDPDRGQVMYEGGHSLANGSESERVAAIRAFLNFSFDAPAKKAPALTDNTIVSLVVEGGNSILFDVDASSTAGNSYAFTWSSTCAGGSFSGTVNSGNNSQTSFDTTAVIAAEDCIITLSVTDLCGRESFKSYGIKIVPPPIAPEANDDTYSTYDIGDISFNALDNDTDINFNIDAPSFTPTSPLTVAGGTFANDGNGAITFTPNEGFSGVATLNYSICDDTPVIDGGPLCDTATITVQIVASPCGLNEPVSSVTDYATAISSENNWKDAGRAIGAPDIDLSMSDNDSGAFLILDLGDEAYVGSQILFRVFSDDGNPYTGTVDAATSPAGFPNNPIAVTVSTEDPVTDIVSYTVLEGGTRYVRITGVKSFGLESVEYQRVICLDSPTPPVANDDVYGTYDITNISFNALGNDTDINTNIDAASFTPTSPLNVAGGTFANDGYGAITFTPNEGFSGTAILTYSICDDTPLGDSGPLCDTATINVQIVASPCGLNAPVSSVTDYATVISSENDWKDADRAIGASDTDFSKSDNDTGAFLILDLGDEAYVGSQILFRVFSDDGGPYTGTVDAATSPAGFPNNQVAVSVSIQKPATDIVSYTVLEGGTRYVRITGVKNFGLESVEYQRVICLDPPTPPVANDDIYGTYDNTNTSFNVLDNDTDINTNIDPSSFSTMSSLTVAGGQFLNFGNGFVGFIPIEGFSGTATLNYSICDDTPVIDGGPLCDTATITVQIVASPCGLNEPVSSVTDYATAISSENNWKDADRAIGAPDIDLSMSDNDSGAFLILDLGDEAFIGSEILFRVFSDDGNPYTGTVDAATSTAGFPNNPLVISVSTQDPATDIVSYTVMESGVRYVRITGVKKFGLESVEYQRVICLPAPAAPVANDDSYATYNSNSITFSPLDNDTDVNNNIAPSSLTPTSPLSVTGGTFVNNGNGTVTFMPNPVFTGTASLDYSVCDDTPALDGGPFCDTATISVEVVASGCAANQYMGSTTAYAAAISSENNWKDAGRAIGAPDANFSKSDNDTGATLVLDLGANVFVGSQIQFRVFSDDGNPYTGAVDAATSAAGFPNNPLAVSVSTQDPATDIVSYTVLEVGTRYVRITGVKSFGLESVEYEMESCMPLPVIDAVTDDFSGLPIARESGGTVGQVLLNDTIDGVPVTASEFNITLDNNDGLTQASLDASGNINIASGANKGLYVLSYSICEKAYPANCDSADIIVSITKDSDGDGISDQVDLDDDNDGILDTDEGCFIESVDFSINSSNVSLSLDNGSDGLVLDVTSLDNSFNLNINGVQLTSTEIEFHSPIRTVEFTDGTYYGGGGVSNIWSIAWNNPVNPDTPLIRLIVRRNGSVELFGSKTRNGPLEPMVFVNGLTVNPISWNAGINTIILDQVVNGNTVMTGRLSSLVSECSLDTDGDGLTDQVDLDSDNDGIYDLIESGALNIAGVNDADDDGVIDGATSTFGSNGLFTEVENNDTSGASITYTISDSDGDTIYDAYELDSDNDSCYDTVEAGFTDGDDDGVLGISTVTVDSNGLVTGQGGYSTPADIDTNSLYDFQEASAVPSITSQPINAIIFTGNGSIFSVAATNTNTYQWQISTDGGAIFTNLVDGGIYTGTDAPTLNISTVDLSMNNNQYRVVVLNTTFVCSAPIVSDQAVLNLKVRTVITNRRVTYRVKSN